MKNPTKHLLVVALIFFNCVEGAMEGNVVGGVSTEIQKYPHSVFLDGRCRAAGHWICGSAVLNQRILLTAAHCVTDCDWKNDDKTRLVAYAGHENLSEVINYSLDTVSQSGGSWEFKLRRCCIFLGLTFLFMNLQSYV